MTADEDTLICSVRWPVSGQALAKLAVGGQAFQYLRLDSAAEQRAEVTVTWAARRIDFPGDTLFGSDIAPIDDGSHITCLSHQGRERMTRGPPAGAIGRVPEAGAASGRAVAGRCGAAGRPARTGHDEAVMGPRYRHRAGRSGHRWQRPWAPAA
jgi:hypothetical protein